MFFFLFFVCFFFFNDTATTEIYTLSLHDALPIFFLELLGIIEVSDMTSDLLLEVCGGENSVIDTTIGSFDVMASNLLRVIGSSKEFHLV